MKVFLSTMGKNLITLPFFLVLSFLDIKMSSTVCDVFFTVSGILFSIGLSQLMSFDFSKITNDKAYALFSNALKSIQESFFYEFIFVTIAYLALVIKESNKWNWIFSLWKFHFSIESELQLIVIFSVLFFLWNYFDLFNNKRKITEKMREEQK